MRTIAAFFILATACAPSPEGSEVNIIGGSEISESEYPAAIALSNQTDGGDNCTGTFIAPRVVLTAAHCVPNFIVYKGHYPNGIYKHKLYTTDSQYVPRYDLAVLTFDNDLAPQTAKLSSKRQAIGTRLTHVGYGCNDLNDRKSNNVRRMGHNKIESYGEAGQIEKNIALEGIIRTKVLNAQTAKDNAGLCPGDSGGPAFGDDGALVGVSSMVYGPEGKDFVYNILVDVSAPTTRQFLAQVVGQGVGIPGITADKNIDLVSSLTVDKPVADRAGVLAKELIDGTFEELKSFLQQKKVQKILVVNSAMKLNMTLSEETSRVIAGAVLEALSEKFFMNADVNGLEIVPYEYLAQMDAAVSDKISKATSNEEALKVLAEAHYALVTSSVEQTMDAPLKDLPQYMEVKAALFFGSDPALDFHR